MSLINMVLLGMVLSTALFGYYFYQQKRDKALEEHIDSTNDPDLIVAEIDQAIEQDRQEIEFLKGNRRQF